MRRCPSLVCCGASKDWFCSQLHRHGAPRAFGPASSRGHQRQLCPSLIISWEGRASHITAPGSLSRPPPPAYCTPTVPVRPLQSGVSFQPRLELQMEDRTEAVVEMLWKQSVVIRHHDTAHKMLVLQIISWKPENYFPVKRLWTIQVETACALNLSFLWLQNEMYSLNVSLSRDWLAV